MLHLLLVERKQKKEIARRLFTKGGTCLAGWATWDLPSC
jgi:hypothetical protein